MFIEIDAKSPVKIIYPKEGTPFVTSPTAIFADAPHPNAARVLQNFLYTAKTPATARSTRAARARCIPTSRSPPGPHAARRRSSCCPTTRSAMLPQIARHQETLHGAVRQLSPACLHERHASHAAAASGAQRSRSIDWTAPFSLLLVLLLASLVLLPMFWLAGDEPAAATPKRLTLEHYRQLFVDPAFVRPLLTTLWTSAAVGVLCIVAAAPMALAGRAHRPAGQALAGAR